MRASLGLLGGQVEVGAEVHVVDELGVALGEDLQEAHEALGDAGAQVLEEPRQVRQRREAVRVQVAVL